jgi:hypothetical protein
VWRQTPSGFLPLQSATWTGRDGSARCLTSFHHHHYLLCFTADFQGVQCRLMSPNIDPAPWIDVLGVLASVAKAVPILGAPFEGSIEALKQILQYTEVSGFD